MSCVVRTPTGSIKLYTKGADTVILERLRKNQNEVLDITCKLLEVPIIFLYLGFCNRRFAYAMSRI